LDGKKLPEKKTQLSGGKESGPMERGREKGRKDGGKEKRGEGRSLPKEKRRGVFLLP